MPKSIAINGTRLDEVRMLLEPYGPVGVSYLMYPMKEIQVSRDDADLSFVVPAYLAVELYRSGILPQDTTVPIEISIDGRTAGRYTVADVRYPRSYNGPFGAVKFTLTRCVLEGSEADSTAPAPLSRSRPRRQGTYVTDITHYLDESGELLSLPGPARKLASFLTLLIEATTTAAPAVDHDSGIRCRKRTCGGTIRTWLLPGQDEIDWHCPACGHNGVIRNWQNTKWNQMKRSEQPG